MTSLAAAKSFQSCPTVRPHRRQPTRLPCPWDSPGKNTGVGCHFLLQCVKVKSKREVSRSCQTLSDPMDYSLPGSSVHGIFQARVLDWDAIAQRSKCLLISWQQSPSAVTLEPKKKKSLSLFWLFPHQFSMKWWDQMPWSLFSECWAEGNGKALQYSCLKNPMNSMKRWKR